MKKLLLKLFIAAGLATSVFAQPLPLQTRTVDPLNLPTWPNATYGEPLLIDIMNGRLLVEDTGLGAIGTWAAGGAGGSGPMPLQTLTVDPNALPTYTAGVYGYPLLLNKNNGKLLTEGLGGGGTPGGSDTQVQFNDGGSFGGSASLTFNKSTGVLTMANPYATFVPTVMSGTTISATAPYETRALTGSEAESFSAPIANGFTKTVRYVATGGPWTITFTSAVNSYNDAGADISGTGFVVPSGGVIEISFMGTGGAPYARGVPGSTTGTGSWVRAAGATMTTLNATFNATVKIPSNTTAQTTEGYMHEDSSTHTLLWYDSQRERSTPQGWTPWAIQTGAHYLATLGSTGTLAAVSAGNGGAIAVPITVGSNMLVDGLQIRNADSANAHTLEWGLYVQDLNNGNAGEKTCRQICYGTFSYTPGSASNVYSTANSGPFYIPPGNYWVVIRNTSASVTAGISDTSISSWGPQKTAQAQAIGALSSTIDLVTGWTTNGNIYGVVLMGRVLGGTTYYQ